MENTFKGYTKAAKLWALPVAAIPSLITASYILWEKGQIDRLNCLYAVLATTVVLYASLLLFMKLRKSFGLPLVLSLLAAVVTSYVSVGGINLKMFLVVFPIGLLMNGSLHPGNISGTVGKQIVRLFGFEMLFPYIWIGICSMAGLLPVQTVIVFLTISVALACASTMKKSLGQETDMLLADLDVRTIKLLLMFSILLVTAFYIA